MIQKKNSIRLSNFFYNNIEIIKIQLSITLKSLFVSGDLVLNFHVGG